MLMRRTAAILLAAIAFAACAHQPVKQKQASSPAPVSARPPQLELEPAAFSLEQSQSPKADPILSGGGLEIFEDGTYTQTNVGTCNIGQRLVFHGGWIRRGNDFILTDQWGTTRRVRMTQGGLGSPVFETVREPSADERALLN
jgi:hypothetical protein